MPSTCTPVSSSIISESGASAFNPSLKYSFLAPGLTEEEYRDYFSNFLYDLDVNRAEKLSEGAFGIALSCKKVGTGESYILKKIKTNGQGTTRERREARDQLKAECRLTVELSLQSPHVIQGLGWIPQHGMLLEHATLGSMRQLMSIRQRPLPIPVIFHVVSSLIKGLASIHEAGYLHLDMKPANIFVHGDGRIVIGDFGLSAPLGSRRPGVAGSPRFMSRRQLKPDVELTREMDWYAVAAIMVEFLDDGCTMFANVTKEDPVWSAGNIVHTVTTLHLRNAYHTPKILHEFDGGLLLLEALRDGVMDPVELLGSSPLNYGSHDVFFSWATGRRTPRFVIPPVSSTTGSVSPSPVHAVSSLNPILRRIQAQQKGSSPYHRSAPRLPLRSSPRAPLAEIIQRHGQTSSPVDRVHVSMIPVPSRIPVSRTPAEPLDEILTESASIRDALQVIFDDAGDVLNNTSVGLTAVNSSNLPSSNFRHVDDRATPPTPNAGGSRRSDNQSSRPKENASNSNQGHTEIPKLTTTAGGVFTHFNQTDKKSEHAQVPTVAALAAEAAKLNTSRLAKPTTARIRLASEHAKSDSAMCLDNLSDPLYSGHDIRMVPLPSRRPATLMGRLARVWRRLHGPPSPLMSSPFLASNHRNAAQPEQQYTAISIDSTDPHSNMSTLHLDQDSNSRNRRQQSTRPSHLNNANNAPVFSSHDRLGFQRMTLGQS